MPSLLPSCKDLVQFVDPKLVHISRLVGKLLRQLEEPRSRLHVAVLVDDERCKHSSASRVFFCGNLSKKMKESRIAVLQGNRVELLHEIGVRDRVPSFGILC